MIFTQNPGSGTVNLQIDSFSDCPEVPHGCWECDYYAPACAEDAAPICDGSFNGLTQAQP